MRILYDSKNQLHKSPFGTLIPGQMCTLRVHVPASVGATHVDCHLNFEDGSPAKTATLSFSKQHGLYHIYEGHFSLEQPGLYFYFFYVVCPNNTFRLFKYGDDTNMEAGDLWQLSCIPSDFTTPDWAKGAVIYQIFPDRFCRRGECDLAGKLKPYILHQDWNEEVYWQPTPEGLILNNDFYGGNFRGIMEKLDYLVSLGVDILYLNPISKSFSSHRYDTGDYKTPDPMLGTLEDFEVLCQAAHQRNLKILLDGVFSHTGSNSLYFNKDGTFDALGAYQSPDSPYASWYDFISYPDTYRSWWGFDTLPTVNKLDPGFLDYIITGEDSVVAHWLRLGADGFRLDVVDELPNAFTVLLKQRIRQIKPDALLIGEVWEDASNKIAYGIRRRYFVDGVLDSAMNYPFRTAILQFMKDRDDGRGIKNIVMTIAENYPPQVLLCNMNLLGTHDTTRILTALVDDFDGSREEKAARRLGRNQFELAKERLLMASFLQYTLPGCPSIYYGDEAGMEGYQDPFNRRTYPWNRENQELLAHFRRLGALRKQHAALRNGDISFFHAGDGKLGFCRKATESSLRIYLNRSTDVWEIPGGRLLFAHNLRTVAPDWLSIAPMGFCIVEE